MSTSALPVSAVRSSHAGSEQLYRTALNALPGAVFTFRIEADGRRTVPLVSDGIYALVGWKPAEVMADVAGAFSALKADALADFEASIQRSYADLSPWTHEFSLTHVTGEPRWIGGQAQPIREPDGATVWHGLLVDITERKRAELALRESQQSYDRLVQHIGDALSVQDVRGRLRFANQRFRELFGIDDSTPITELVLGDFVSPAWRTRLREQHQRRVRGEAIPIHFEFEAVRLDGKKLWLEATVVTIEDEGRIVGTQAVLHDLTDRKRIEDALRLLSAGTPRNSPGRTPAPGAVQSACADLALQMARLLDVEVAFIAQVLPENPTRMRTLAWMVDGRLAVPISYDLAHSPSEAVAKGTSCVFERCVTDLFPADRTLSQLNASGYAAVPLFEQGRPCGVVGVISRKALRQADRVEAILHLFSVRVAAELERERQEARFHDLFEFSPDATIIVDRDGRITLANQRATAIFGYDRTELLAMSVERLMPADSAGAENRPCFLAVEVTREMHAAPGARQARRRDGTVFPVEIALSPIESAGPLQMVIVIRDVTERVRAVEQRQALEDRLRHGQKMEALGTLAGGVAHDFNNLLAIINGHAELVTAVTPASDSRQDSLAEIVRAGQRGVALTDQILSFSRRHVREVRMVDLNAVIAEMRDMLTRLVHDGVTLAVEPGADIGCVEADPEQLAQVVMNLATNASDAMPAGGTLTIATSSAEVREGGCAEMPTLAPGPYVVLRVSDTGLGMDAATRRTLFEPFFTTKEQGKGTGLGLSIVYGIVQHSGGAISVESSPGCGATFTIYLPRTTAAVPTAGARTNRSLATGSGTVLVVDDEAAIAQMAGAMLRMAGYTSLMATSGDEALRIIESGDQPIDVLLTDVMMPGMNGRELVDRVTAARPGTRVLYMSGFTRDSAVLGSAAERASAFIAKPFTAAALTRKIRDLFDSAAIAS